MPPEWHPQDWIWIGFPHDPVEWPGFLSRAQEQIAAFANAVANLQSGEISAIIETPGSLYIFKMIERNNGNPRPLETVRPEIEKILLEKNREEAFTEWQTGLKKNAYIDIRD